MWQQISVRGVAKAIAERPELEVAVHTLEGVTLGEIYRAVFPEGVSKKTFTTSKNSTHGAISIVDELNDDVRFVEDFSTTKTAENIATIEASPGPTTLPSSTTQPSEPFEVTPKVNQITLQTIFADDEKARITRSTTLTSVPESLDSLSAADFASSNVKKPSDPPVVRPNLIGFDSTEAGAKLREWMKAYFSG